MDEPLKSRQKKFLTTTKVLKFQETQSAVIKSENTKKDSDDEDDTSKSKEKSDACYLQQLITALGDFYYTMILENDDEMLLCYLRYTNYDIPKSVKFVHSSDNFLRTQEHLLRIPFAEIRPMFDHEGIWVFKQPDHEGRKVALLQARFWDVDVHDIDHLSVALSYLMDELLFNSIDCQVNGLMIIVDWGGIGHMKAAYILSKITRQQIMMIIKAYQNIFPVKIKGMFLLNVPMIIAATYNAFKYFIQRKKRDRIHLNCSFTDLHKFFSKDYLPEKALMGNVPDEMCQDHEFFDRLRKRKCRFENFQPSLIP